MNHIHCSSLQVFLPTYNRPALLRKTIHSVLGQTIKVPHICVLDNGGFPATREMLAEFDGLGIEFRDTREFGNWGNLIAAQKLLQREYVLLLHDDDLIHPEYLHTALSIFHSVPDINLLTAHTVPWDINQTPQYLPPLSTKGHLFSSSDYATYVYNARHPSYSLAIYRRDAFQAIQMQANFDRYGKWGDVPLMLEAISFGKAAVLTDACGWMGMHPGQDSNDESTRPRYQAWIAREANFLRFMGDNPLTLSGLSFCIMNYRHLSSGYRRRVRKDITFKQFLDEARSANALTKRGDRARLISFRLVQKIFEGYMRRRYRREACPLVSSGG
jgi:glycosyltransferase involved in cell wall biosynthesis